MNGMTEPIKRNKSSYQDKLLDIVNGDMFDVSRLIEEQKALNNALLMMLDDASDTPIEYVKNRLFDAMCLLSLKSERLDTMDTYLENAADDITEVVKHIPAEQATL